MNLNRNISFLTTFYRVSDILFAIPIPWIFCHLTGSVLFVGSLYANMARYPAKVAVLL